MSLAASPMGLHHQLCHLLAGRFNLSHAHTHAVLLPYVMAYNAPATPLASAHIAAALGSDDAADGLRSLAKTLGAPTSLKAVGMPARGIDDAIRAVMANAYPNPVPPQEHTLRRLLERAFEGEEPQHA